MEGQVTQLGHPDTWHFVNSTTCIAVCVMYQFCEVHSVYCMYPLAAFRIGTISITGCKGLL